MQHATTIQFGALHQRHVTISRLRGTCSVWRTPHNAYMPPLRPSRNVVQLPHGQPYTSVNREPVEEVDSGTSKEDGPRLQIGAYFLRSFVFGFVGFVRFLRRYRSRYLLQSFSARLPTTSLEFHCFSLFSGKIFRILFFSFHFFSLEVRICMLFHFYSFHTRLI